MAAPVRNISLPSREVLQSELDGGRIREANLLGITRKGRYEVRTGNGNDTVYLTQIQSQTHDKMYALYLQNSDGTFSAQRLTQAQVDRLDIHTEGGDDNIVIDESVDSDHKDGLRIFAGHGDDNIVAHGDVQRIEGNRGNDAITVAGDARQVRGNQGDDLVFVAKGGFIKKLKAGKGKDELTNDGKIGKAKMGGGRDKVLNRGEIDKLRSGTGRDNLMNEDARFGPAVEFVRGAEPAPLPAPLPPPPSAGGGTSIAQNIRPMHHLLAFLLEGVGAPAQPASTMAQPAQPGTLTFPQDAARYPGAFPTTMWASMRRQMWNDGLLAQMANANLRMGTRTVRTA